jgi:sulfite reductase (NADPH) hemoprotein beta-component
MYQYDSFDQRLVEERALQFKGQVERRLAGEITEDEFKPLRLQNGLYMQLHAYMLRVAVPYGLLSSKQLRKLAHISRTYDKAYGHFTTRQNMQFNWPKLEDVPKILEELAEVQMHAIQTSGNCIRNVTSDHLAGVARDELEDPRPYCEIIRQWSTFHPEFAFLPRKFKIAVTGSMSEDRAAVRFHDIGVRIVRSETGAHGFEIWVGGGLGRSPFVGECIRSFLPTEDLLSYLESILRVYNQHGRRDNKFKARIKILVNALGAEEFTRLVEEEWEHNKSSSLKLTSDEIARVSAYFAPPAYETLPASDTQLEANKLSNNRNFGHWVKNNVLLHKVPGYNAVVVSLKAPQTPPGDVTDKQMEAIATLADRFGFGRMVVTHTQNLILPDVKTSELSLLWEQLVALDLATPNHNKITDIISCPGLDYCNLATARSIPIALAIQDHFENIDYVNDLGDLSIKISGCINACGHHHVGNIGILGIDKHGEEFYQVSLGGAPGNDAAIGKIIGRSFSTDEIVPAIEKIVQVYLQQRTSEEERFLETLRRIGLNPFKDALYGNH